MEKDDDSKTPEHYTANGVLEGNLIEKTEVNTAKLFTIDIESLSLIQWIFFFNREPVQVKLVV